MMRESKLTKIAQGFIRRIKPAWQMIFFPAVLLYAVSLVHFFYTRPAPRHFSATLLRNLDLISFLIAILLAGIIFNMKRRYFSSRFIRRYAEVLLEESPSKTADKLTNEVFEFLRRKLMLVWILGGVIVLEGVLYYWITLTSNNMHTYFVIGAFSLFLNYPRAALFEEVPWYVRQAQQEGAGANKEP